MFPRHLLLSASALVAVSSLSAPAFAVDYNTAIFGGGASLPAPYLRQAGNCYGADTALLKRTGATSAAEIQSTSDFCDADYSFSNNTLNYISTGSGVGLKGFYTNRPSEFGRLTDGTSYYDDVDFAVSETALGEADVTAYKSGGTSPAIGSSYVFAAANTSPTGSQFANPNDTFGAMIQIPALVAPVAIAYKPTYTNSAGTSFPLNNGNDIELTQEQYCKVFAGQITNWKQIGTSLKATNDPDTASAFSVPLHVVVRSDSSGTSSLFTRHLATVCGSAGLSPNPFTGSVSTYANLNINGLYSADQSSGVAAAIAANNGGIGYVGLDYVGTYGQNTGSDYGLKAAKLRNSANVFVAPSPASALAAFTAGFTAPSTGEDLAKPDKWVVPANTYTSPSLANPSGSDSYPIVGTSNLLAYSCYATTNRANTVRDFITWYYTDADVNDAGGILQRAGFAPVPSELRTQIIKSFIDGSDNNNLKIEATSTIPGAKCYGKGA
jgi:ABC-type phosphate transport system substrate-binding protein